MLKRLAQVAGRFVGIALAYSVIGLVIIVPILFVAASVVLIWYVYSI